MADHNTADREADAKSGKAMPGGRFPIENKADLQNAIRAVGRAKGGAAGRAAVRRFIMKRAKVLGASNMIPKSWRPDGTLWTMAEDHAQDKKRGIKEGSPEDKKIDASRGLKD